MSKPRHHSLFMGTMDEHENVQTISFESPEGTIREMMGPVSDLFIARASARGLGVIIDENKSTEFLPETRSTYDSDQDKESPVETNRSVLSGMAGRITRAGNNFHKSIFKNKHSKKEGVFVFVTASFLAFNIGFANGATMSGFLTPSRDSYNIAGMGGSWTNAALAVAHGDVQDFGFYSMLVVSYMIGNLCVGLIAPDPVPWNMQPAYGPTFLIGGTFELIAALLSHFQFTEQYIFFFATAATGVQNGIASSYSANLLRCALTGTSTDLALCIGHVLRGNHKDLWRIYVLTTICSSFWIGSLVAFYAARRFLSQTLFVNAGLFFLMGVGLIVFLVQELDISAKAAVLGTWKWRDTMDKLSMARFGENFSELHFRKLFDEIDTDSNGLITSEELLDYLLGNQVNISGKGVKILLKHADENGDGHIDREEWDQICNKFFKSTTKTSARSTRDV